MPGTGYFSGGRLVCGETEPAGFSDYRTLIELWFNLNYFNLTDPFISLLYSYIPYPRIIYTVDYIHKYVHTVIKCSMKWS